jgi:hypothetical protein
MKTLSFFVMILLWVGCTSPKTNVQTDSQAGTVLFKVKPSSAKVIVDGKESGKARDYDGKRAVLRLSPGTHIIELKAEGYKPEAYKIYLSDTQEFIESNLVKE